MTVDRSKMHYAVAPMSLGHTFGNVTAFVAEFIKGWFPPNYFKTVTISSTMAYRYFNIFNNTNKEFIKRNKPMLVIRPRVDIMNEDVFLNQSLLTTRITDNFLDNDYGNLLPFIDDQQKQFFVKFLMNRMKLFFDVTIVVETQMEQINQMVYVKNRVRHNYPFIIQTSLESHVPRHIMKGISLETGIELDNTKEFLDYVNGNSFYPVTYKMKNSTGNDEFFRYYPAQIDSIMRDLSMDDGSRKGLIDDAYTINFTFETEFTTSGLYYLFSRQKKNIDSIAGLNQDSGIGDSSTINPIFTISNLFDVALPPGWNLYASPLYKVETNIPPYDLDFSQLLNRSLQAGIDYHLKKGIPLEKLIKIYVLKDNVKLNELNGDYEVDYNNLTLKTNVLNIASTYRMIIHVNTLYVNNLITDILNLEKES